MNFFLFSGFLLLFEVLRQQKLLISILAISPNEALKILLSIGKKL